MTPTPPQQAACDEVARAVSNHPSCHHAKTPRDMVQDMKPLEAVDYLLGVVEMLVDIKFPEVTQIDTWGFDYTLSERRVLLALVNARGPVSRQALHSAVYFDRHTGGDLPNDSIITVLVSRLRRKIPDNAEIVSRSGYGYALRFHERKAVTA